MQTLGSLFLELYSGLQDTHGEMDRGIQDIGRVWVGGLGAGKGYLRMLIGI